MLRCLTCPHLQFKFWPTVMMELTCRLLDNPERVDIRCVECILDGSPAVKQLRLTDHVEFDVHTCFTSQQGKTATRLNMQVAC